MCDKNAVYKFELNHCGKKCIQQEYFQIIYKKPRLKFSSLTFLLTYVKNRYFNIKKISFSFGFFFQHERGLVSLVLNAETRFNSVVRLKPSIYTHSLHKWYNFSASAQTECRNTI